MTPKQPPSSPIRAAIYTRISSDPSGERAGVERQRVECLALAQRQGWTVVGLYEDNDRSAYSRKPRPQFERLVTDAKVGAFDVVVVWAADRLYRLMRDLVRIADELAPHARIVTVMSNGEGIDLTTSEGILRAQVMGSVGEFESRRKSERVTARAKQRAAVDGRMFSSKRPFGWRWADPCPGGAGCQHQRTCATAGERPRQGSRAGLLIDETEAPAVRAVFAYLADGGSVRGVARLLGELGHVGTGGVPFKAETVRRVLTQPRQAGKVAYLGEVVADAADGQAIVDFETWARVQDRLADPTRRTSPGRPANTPLSGIARCGRCGGPMNATNKHRGKGRVDPAYICARNLHLTRRRALVDEFVLRTVGEWLVANAEAIRAQATPEAPAHVRAASTEVVELTERLATLHQLVAGGELDPRDYAESARAVRERLREAQARAVVVSGNPATARLLAAEDVAAEWKTLRMADNVEPLRAVLREVLTGVRVKVAAVPSRPTADDLEIVWAPWLGRVDAAA